VILKFGDAGMFESMPRPAMVRTNTDSSVMMVIFKHWQYGISFVYICKYRFDAKTPAAKRW
jgi:hypothetical protein